MVLDEGGDDGAGHDAVGEVDEVVEEEGEGGGEEAPPVAFDEEEVEVEGTAALFLQVIVVEEG